VILATPRLAASLNETDSGKRIVRPAGTRVYSAKAPVPSSRKDPNDTLATYINQLVKSQAFKGRLTRSPTLTLVTLEPTAAMTPARSTPRILPG